MKAGYAYADITPAVGCTLNGFIARYRPAEAVDLPLNVRALWLEDDRRAAVLVGIDALGLTDRFAEGLVAELSAATGVPPEGIILHASHTHAGAMTVPLRGIGAADEGYLMGVRRQALLAAADAKAGARAVEAAWGTAAVQIGINRRQRLAAGGTILGRNPDGPCDRGVRVLHLQGGGKSIVVFNHACHPLCIGPQDSVISPDFFGHAAAALEGRGHAAMYFNGCAGDINPQRAGESPAAAKEEGQRLAAAVLAAVRDERPMGSVSIAARSKRLAVPYQPLPPMGELEGAIAGADRTVRAEDRAQAVVRERIADAGRQWLDDLRRVTSAGKLLPPAMARASVVGIGPVAFVALPGEVFFKNGQDIAEALGARQAMLAAYCFAYIGYVCPSEAYDEGGYEPDESHRYVSYWKLSRQATQMLRETAAELWGLVRAATR